MPTDPQLRALRIYGALCNLHENWGGQLVLAVGSGAAASLIAPAASIAGAATLLIEEDAAAIKSAFRRGELDFVVNSLDEALRALKNEVRQRRPLSVGLTQAPADALAEAAARGLLPDLHIAAEGSQLDPGATQSLAALTRAGMKTFYVAADGTSPQIAEYLSRNRWQEITFPVANLEALRQIDARQNQVLSPDDICRRRWLSYSAAYLRSARMGARTAFLSPAERAALAAIAASPPQSPATAPPRPSPSSPTPE